MQLLRYTHIIYFAATWIFVFIFIGFKRIRELLPVAVLGVLTLTTVDLYVTSLGLYQFNKPVVNILGTPLFHLLWGGGAAVVFIYYTGQGFNRKLVNVIFFTIITLILEFIAEKAGVAQRLGNYGYLHSAILDFSSLVVLLWISEGLYGNRIFKRER